MGTKTAFHFAFWMAAACCVRVSLGLRKQVAQHHEPRRFRRIIPPGDPSMVWAAKAGLFVALTIALFIYGLNCQATATPEHAMRCCDTMRCHSPQSHRSQDCCNTTPEMYAVLGQPGPPLSASFSPVTLGTVEVFRHPLSVFVASSIVGNHSHDPPQLPVPAMELALRI